MLWELCIAKVLLKRDSALPSTKSTNPWAQRHNIQLFPHCLLLLVFARWLGLGLLIPMPALCRDWWRWSMMILNKCCENNAHRGSCRIWPHYCGQLHGLTIEKELEMKLLRLSFVAGDISRGTSVLLKIICRALQVDILLLTLGKWESTAGLGRTGVSLWLKKTNRESSFTHLKE